jgi:mannose-6-phosphate isomerase
MTQPYPLRFKEILRNYSFGNRWIAKALEKEDLPPGHRLAETWEVCDRGKESSIVKNGPLAGRTLRQVIDQHGEALLGHEVCKRYGGRFPLLIKFLDCSNVLGEQVHQNDDVAVAMGLEDPGKTEAWYMVETTPDAEIRCGTAPGLTTATLRQACRHGTVNDAMVSHTVQPGDSFLLYAGTMHYSPGGILLYEIMQNSDVLIGLTRPADAALPEDKRRKMLDDIERSVHIEEAANYKTQPVTVEARDNTKLSYILACEHFALMRLDLEAGVRAQLPAWQTSFSVVSAIKGHSAIEHEGACPPATVRAIDASALLIAWVPDLRNDVIDPLLEQGVPPDRIEGLGGRSSKNPLRTLLRQEK